MMSFGTIVRVLLLVLVVAAVMMALVYFKLFPILPAAFIATGCLVAGLLWTRVSALGTELETYRAQSSGTAELEQDFNRRIDTIAQQVATLSVDSGTQTTFRFAALQKQLSAMTERLVSVEKNVGLSFETVGAEEAAKHANAVSEHTSTGIVAKPGALAKIDLKDALKGGALNMHLQPLVELPDRKPRRYDAFMRLQLKNGNYLDAQQFIKVAEKGSLMSMIDKKIIFSAIRMVRTLREMDKNAGIFCTISPDTLNDASKFRQIFSMLEANAGLKSSLVIGITQRHFRHLSAASKTRLLKVVDLGFGLSLDQVQDLNVNGAALRRDGFRYLRTAVDLLLHANLYESGPSTAPELAATLSDQGIVLIATDVERETQVINLIDFGVGIAQGIIFAPPRPVRAELLAGPAANVTKKTNQSAA